jgi:hypothetical protein
MIDLTLNRGAIFSDDRKYRYVLWRVWNRENGLRLSIGLNPSTAAEFSDDPTITRDIKRAYLDGFGGLIKWNLFAEVSAFPEILALPGDHIGTNNDSFLKESMLLSKQHVIGWGTFPEARERAKTVLSMIPEPYCLGVNQDGSPKHPLYVAYRVPMVRY